MSCPAGAESACTGVLGLTSAKAIQIGGIKLRVHAVASSEEGDSLTQTARNATLRFPRG